MASSSRYRRKIIIGDVHGCYDELIALLNELEYDNNLDEVYLVGDLVVKGPKSNEVIEFARTHSNCYAVLGNHDYYLLTAAKHLGHYPTEDRLQVCQAMDDVWPPSVNTRHLEAARSVTLENIDYLQSLPLHLYADRNREILIVHAGIVPDPKIKLEKQTDFMMMVIRNVYFDGTEMIATSKMVDGCRPWIRYYNGWFGHIFFGHDATKGLQIGAFATGLETGCCYGNKLTAAIIKCDDEFSILHEDECIDEKFGIMEWEKNAERRLSRTSHPFPYWLYSIDSFKMYQKPKGGANSELLQLLDRVIWSFA